MREIKFRAWNKHTHKMSDWAELKTLYNQNVFEQAVVTLMQFTGLKDKNGVEIYEGDILRWMDSDALDDYEVIYEAPSFKYVSLSNPDYIGGKRAFDELEAEKDFEVVGNIYENPDLLTNTTEGE